MSALDGPSIGLWTLLEIALFSPTKFDYAHRVYWETVLINNVFSPTGPNKYENFSPGPNAPINITPIIQVEHLEALEEKHGVMTIHGTLLLNWKDSRLKWNATAYGGINQISKTRSYLKVANAEPFIPKLYATELFTKFGDMLSSEPTMVSIRSNGLISIATRFKTRTTCHFKFDKYPHDEQNCSVTLYTPMPMSQVQLIVFSYGRKTPTKTGSGKPIYLGQFLFAGVEAKTMYLLPGSYKISDPKKFPPQIVRSVGYYNFIFKRIDSFYTVRMAHPVFSISFLIYGFSLVHSLHAIPWLVIAFIAQVLITCNIKEALPVDYDSLPSVAWILTLTMVQTFLFIIWKAVYMNFEQRQPLHKEVFQKMNLVEYYYRFLIPILILYNWYMIYCFF